MTLLNAKLEELRILEESLAELQKMLNNQKKQFEYVCTQKTKRI